MLVSRTTSFGVQFRFEIAAECVKCKLSCHLAAGLIQAKHFPPQQPTNRQLPAVMFDKKTLAREIKPNCVKGLHDNERQQQ